MSAQPNAYQDQDGQALFQPGPGKQPHPEWRFRTRGARHLSVRWAWREGEPVPYAGPKYARLHRETDTLLISEYGFISTVVNAQEIEDESFKQRIHEATGYEFDDGGDD